jgi:high frequency lysogenization protein
MSHTLVSNQVLALAGIAQAAALVSNLARTGSVEASAMQGTVHSILTLDSPDCESIFIDKTYLLLGLKTVRDIFERETNTSTEIMRYCASMLHLQKQLVSDKSMLNVLRQRIQQVQKQVELLGDETNHQVFNSIAGVYSDTLSTFQFRIQVNGKPELLKQDNITHQIRTALLGGVRAVTLWRQLGGSKLDFIFKRKAIYNTTLALLKA